MIIRQPIKHSITNEGEDSFNMGRWSYSTIRGRNKRRVTIITAYQTCECDMATQGVTTFPSQQWTLLEQKGLEEGNIRKRMIKELISFINKLQRQQHEVILLIDANESITDSNSLIGKLLSQTQMCDPIFKQHGSKHEPNTHIKVPKELTIYSALSTYQSI